MKIDGNTSVVEVKKRTIDSLYGLCNVTKDCRTCVNMSCNVEQNEKPIDGCL